MTLIQSVIFGFVQGVTEFLPVSSSGHLFILQKIFHIKELPLLFDVLLHISTLLAVFIVFYKDLISILISLVKYIFRKQNEEDLKNINLFVKIIISTLITFVFVLLFKKVGLFDLKDEKVIYSFFIATGILMIIPSILNGKSRTVSLASSVLIGVMQGIAILPGISRSGSCIAGGVLSGLRRQEATRFAFLLSIPAILGSLLFTIKDAKTLTSLIDFKIILLGMCSALLFGILSLKLLVFIAKTKKLYIFSIYLFIIGIAGLLGVF